MKHHSKYVAFFSFLMMSFGFFATQLYKPCMPAMKAAFDVGNSEVQLTMTFYYMGFALCQLFYGPWSDKFGRRPTILLGLIIGVIGTMGCVFSDSIKVFWACRLMQGMGLGAANTLSRTILKDTFDHVKMARASSFIMVATGFVPAVLPYIGGTIQETLTWQYVFGLAALYFVASLVLIFFFLPETIKTRKPNALHVKELLEGYVTFLSNRWFVSNLAFSAVSISGMVCYDVAAPFIYRELVGITPIQIGKVFFFTAAAAMLGSFVNGMLVQKTNPQLMLKAGISCQVISGIAIVSVGLAIQAGYGTTTIYSVLLPSLLFYFGCGLVFPNAQAGAFAQLGHRAGSASAVFGCIRSSVQMGASGIIAWLPETTQAYFGSVILVLAVVSVMMYRLVLPRELKAHNA